MQNIALVIVEYAKIANANLQRKDRECKKNDNKNGSRPDFDIQPLLCFEGFSSLRKNKFLN